MINFVIKLRTKLQKFRKHSQQNNSEIVTNEHDKEIHKGGHISPVKRQKIIDELRLKHYNNRISKNYKGFKKLIIK